jgi:amidohydrolase
LDYNFIFNESEKIKGQLIKWRRHFHKHPETELDCFETSKFIQQELRKMNIEVKTGFAKTGLVGIIEGKSGGKVIGIRADMDALPIKEQTGLPFASENEGVSHACGHDGHMAMCLGVAKVLSDYRDKFTGTIKLLFEPGEEYPGGAKLMVEDGALENPKVDAIIGCHIYPEIDTGKFGLRYGAMTARNDEFTIQLKGPGGHGAHPDEVPDPMIAAGFFITQLQTIVSRFKHPVEPLVINLGHIFAEGSYNVIVQSVCMKGTIRSIDYGLRNQAINQMDQILKGLKTAFNVDYDLKIVDGEPPLFCDKELTSIAENMLVRLFGKEKTIIIERPSMGAENFAFYSEKVPVVYLRIGSRDEAQGFINPLHSAKFNFDENILPQGIAVIGSLALKLLK